MVPKNNSIRHQTWVESTGGDSVRLARTSNIKRVCLSICVLIFSCMSMVIPISMLTFDIYVHTYMFARVRTCFHVYIYIYIGYNHEYIPEVYICVSIRLSISKQDPVKSPGPDQAWWPERWGKATPRIRCKPWIWNSSSPAIYIPCWITNWSHHVSWILVIMSHGFWWDSVPDSGGIL